ncbi:MAG: radical SAM protein [Kosmotogaceae bacterium]
MLLNLGYNLGMNIIPIFLPFAGCKKRCVFCNEIEVTGQKKSSSHEEIVESVLKYRNYFKDKKNVEFAFYGGSFLNLPEELLRQYCRTVQFLLNRGLITGIRFSTSPESISKEKIEFIKEFPVSLIELGAQSFFDDVLEKSNRPHDVQDIYNAVEILSEEKIDYGIHLMTGLPGDSQEKSIISSFKTAELKPKTCRIHPTLILRNTTLERMYNEGNYIPQTMEYAIETVMYMYAILVSNEITVNRMGLCLYGDQTKNVVAGPFHESFGELVRSRLSIEIIRFLLDKISTKKLVINDDDREKQIFTGYKKWVKRWLKKEGITVVYSSNGYSIDIIETIRLLYDKIKRGRRFSFPGVKYET